MFKKNRRSRGKSTTFYIPLKLIRLSGREADAYWANQFRIGTDSARRAYASRTGRSVFALKHPNLAGMLLFSAIESDLTQIMSKVIGAIDARLIDRELSKSELSTLDDFGILSEEDMTSLSSLGSLFGNISQPQDECDEKKDQSWSPFSNIPVRK